MSSRERQRNAPYDSRSRRNETDVWMRDEGDEGDEEIWALAWWEGYGRERSGEEEDGAKHRYKTHLKPSKPLAIGERVRLLAMPKSAPTTPGAWLHDYRAYDPHVVGVVMEIKESTEGWAKATIRNLCRGNTVRTVELDMAYTTDETAQDGQLSGKWATREWGIEEPPMECTAHLRRPRRSGRRAGKHERHDAQDVRDGDVGTPSTRTIRSCGAERVGGAVRNGRAERNNGAERSGRAERDEGVERGGEAERRRAGEERRRKEGVWTGRMTCGAGECGLTPQPGSAARRAGRPWKVMSIRVRKEEPTTGLEGATGRHMWLKDGWTK